MSYKSGVPVSEPAGAGASDSDEEARLAAAEEVRRKDAEAKKPKDVSKATPADGAGTERPPDAPVSPTTATSREAGKGKEGEGGEPSEPVIPEPPTTEAPAPVPSDTWEDVAKILSKARTSRVQNEEMDRVRSFIKKYNKGDARDEGAETVAATDVAKQLHERFGIDTTKLPSVLDGATPAQLRHLNELLLEDRAQVVRAQTEQKYNEMLQNRVRPRGKATTWLGRTKEAVLSGASRMRHGGFRAWRETGIMQKRMKAVNGALLLDEKGERITKLDSPEAKAYLSALFDRVKAGGESFGGDARRYTSNDTVNEAAKKFLETTKLQGLDTAKKGEHASAEAARDALDVALSGYFEQQKEKFRDKIQDSAAFKKAYGSKTAEEQKKIATEMAVAAAFTDQYDVRNRIYLDQVTQKNSDALKTIKALEKGGWWQRVGKQLRSSVAVDAGASGVALGVGARALGALARFGGTAVGGAFGYKVATVGAGAGLGAYRGYKRSEQQMRERVEKRSEQPGEDAVTYAEEDLKGPILRKADLTGDKAKKFQEATGKFQPELARRKEAIEIAGLRTRSADSVKKRLDTIIAGLGDESDATAEKSYTLNNAMPFVFAIERLMQSGSVALGTGKDRAKNEREIREKMTQAKAMIAARALNKPEIEWKRPRKDASGEILKGPDGKDLYDMVPSGRDILDTLSDHKDPKERAKGRRSKVYVAFEESAQKAKERRKSKQRKAALIGAGAGAIGALVGRAIAGKIGEEWHEHFGAPGGPGGPGGPEAPVPDGAVGPDGGSISGGEDLSPGSPDILPPEETTETVLTPPDFIKRFGDAFQHIKRNLWYDNDTGAPRFDLNELRLRWAGLMGRGVDANGNFVMNVKDMLKSDSFHGSTSADAPDLLQSGELKAILSLSKDTSNDVALVDIDPSTGNLVMDPSARPELAPFFHVGPDGKAVFDGRFIEIVHFVGKDANGNDLVNILATYEGDGVEEIPIPSPELEPTLPPEVAGGSRTVEVPGSPIGRIEFHPTPAEPDATSVMIPPGGVEGALPGVPSDDVLPPDSRLEIAKQKLDSVFDWFRGLAAGRDDAADIQKDLEPVEEALENDMTNNGPYSDEDIEQIRLQILTKMMPGTRPQSGIEAVADVAHGADAHAAERAMDGVSFVHEHSPEAQSFLESHQDIFQHYEGEKLNDVITGRNLNYFRLHQLDAALSDSDLLQGLSPAQEELRAAMQEAVQQRLEQVGVPALEQVAEDMVAHNDRYNEALDYLYELSRQPAWDREFPGVPRLSDILESAPNASDMVFHYDDLPDRDMLYEALQQWVNHVSLMEKAGDPAVTAGMQSFKADISRITDFLHENCYVGGGLASDAGAEAGTTTAETTAGRVAGAAEDAGAGEAMEAPIGAPTGAKMDVFRGIYGPVKFLYGKDGKVSGLEYAAKGLKLGRDEYDLTTNDYEPAASDHLAEIGTPHIESTKRLLFEQTLKFAGMHRTLLEMTGRGLGGSPEASALRDAIHDGMENVQEYYGSGVFKPEMLKEYGVEESVASGPATPSVRELHSEDRDVTIESDRDVETTGDRRALTETESVEGVIRGDIAQAATEQARVLSSKLSSGEIGDEKAMLAYIKDLKGAELTPMEQRSWSAEFRSYNPKDSFAADKIRLKLMRDAATWE